MKQFLTSRYCILACLFYLTSSAYAETVEIAIKANETVGEVKPLLGVNAGPYRVGDATQHVQEQYRDVGVTEVRTHDFYGPLDMHVLYDETGDPSLPGSYDFTESDARMEMIVENGHPIYFRIGNSYDEGGHPPQNVDNYIEAALNVIRHYTEGLWDGYTYSIPYIEIWNEPENHTFWTGTLPDFLEFFGKMAKALKIEFPNSKIGGPGFLATGYFAPDINSFPRDLIRYCKINNVPLDFISWHIYSNDPDDYRKAGLFYRNLLDSFGYENVESHITEWNTEDGAIRYNARGAALMTGAWIGLQDGEVDLSTFFRGQDTSPSLPTFYGMFFANGSYKKVAYAFKSWSWLRRYPVRIQLEETAETVSGIAGMSKDGNTLAILLTHYSVDGSSDSIDQYQIVLDDWITPTQTVHIERYAISDAYNLDLLEDRTAIGLSSSLPSRVTFVPKDFPQNRVELLILTREGLAGVEEWDRY